MALDPSRSDSNWKLVKDIVTGAEIAREGLLLQSTLEDGIEKVQVTDGSGDVCVGFSLSDNSSDTDAPFVQTMTVPATSPYTVTLSHTPMGTAPTAEICVRTAAGVKLTQVADAGGSLNGTGKFHVTGTTLSFHSADASVAHVASFRYALTAEQAKQLYYDRSVNNGMGALFGQVAVLMGSGQVFTYEYDDKVNWADSSLTVKSGADGIITLGGGGTDLTGIVRVISVPTAEDPALGLAFKF